MTMLEFLSGVEMIEEGMPGVRLPETSHQRYYDAVHTWNEREWAKAMTTFMNAPDPLKRFPSIGQCKAMLTQTGGVVHDDLVPGCIVCEYTGWVVVPDPKADAFYSLPAGTREASAYCRCAKGSRGMAANDRIAQISQATYAQMAGVA